MKIRIIKSHIDSLELTNGKVYEIQDKREFLTNGVISIAIDILDDDGTLETLVNSDEADYEFVYGALTQ